MQKRAHIVVGPEDEANHHDPLTRAGDKHELILVRSEDRSLGGHVPVGDDYVDDDAGSGCGVEIGIKSVDRLGSEEICVGKICDGAQHHVRQCACRGQEQGRPGALQVPQGAIWRTVRCEA